VRRALRIGSLTLACLVTFLVAPLVILVATGTLKLYAIPTSAMEPTLHCPPPFPGCEGNAKDRVVALTRLVSYGRGDIVVFRASPEMASECGVPGTYVKRIIGLPGETVEIRSLGGAGHVFVDGQRLEEPYVEDERRDDAGPEERFRVPEDHFFVLGDNRAQSCDSRVYGPIAESDVRGKLVATYWPLDRITIR
jgi:signal peptidase I